MFGYVWQYVSKYLFVTLQVFWYVRFGKSFADVQYNWWSTCFKKQLPYKCAILPNILWFTSKKFFMQITEGQWSIMWVCKQLQIIRQTSSDKSRENL